MLRTFCSVLSLSVSLISITSSLIASKTSQDKEDHHQSPPPLLQDKSSQELDAEWEAQRQNDHRRWISQQTPFQGFNTTASVTQVTSAMGHLGIHERPLTRGQCTYVKSPDGKTTLSRHADTPESHRVLDYGLSPTQVAYVANDNKDHRETFTTTLPKGQTYKNGRKHPFHAFTAKIHGVTIAFDAGHGIDQADTVVRYGRNSSTDPQNFVPQNRFYNQNIRNHMVQHTIRPKGGAYKEISVYDDKKPTYVTLSNKEKCELPVGFIFVAYKNHQIERTFYFPNLISYDQLIKERGLKSDYKTLMSYFEIPTDSISNDVVSHGEIDEHARIVREHEGRGYRSLSGRYDPVSHIKIPRPAKAALRRYLALHHLEQAAHMEFRSIENKAAVVGIYTSSMKYIHLDNASATEKAQRKALYWQAYKDEEAKLAKEIGVSPDQVDLVDYAISDEFFLARLNNQIAQDDPWEIALKRVQNTHKKLEEGQGLYYPERGKAWLKRIEKTVDDNPVIDDIIRLLELYNIPELMNLEKRSHFEDLLMQKGKKANFDEQKSIGDYFDSQLRDADRDGEKEKLQDLVSYWLKSIEKRISKSRNIQEVTQAAEWYHSGDGIIRRDGKKAKSLYHRLLPHVDESEKRRIQYCIDCLESLAADDRPKKTDKN